MILFADAKHKDKVAAALRELGGDGAACSCHFTAGGVQAWPLP